MKAIYLALSLLSFNIVLSQELFNGKKVNTNPLNKQYRDSRKFFYGELNSKQYADFKSILENELETSIEDGKSIFINFE